MKGGEYWRREESKIRVRMSENIKKNYNANNLKMPIAQVSH